MNNQSLGATKTATAAGLVFVVVLLAEGVQAQRQPANRPRTDSQVTNSDLGIRDMQVRSLELSKENKGDVIPTAAPEVIKQVREDFGRIQEINAEVMRAYASGAPPDYKEISEAMADINKRAARLNANLLLPQLEKYEVLQEKDGSPLIQLNALIISFVTNPIFKNANTIDADQGVKAKRDLENIIDLSSRIRKSADRLQKTGGKAQ